ncbi:hypothetical protein KUCAC02_034543, partial [Chaenocephalus aceratus]
YHHDNPAVAMTMGKAPRCCLGIGPAAGTGSETGSEQEVVDLLTQLLDVQKEIANNQNQVVKLLGMLGAQGEQQILDLQNVGPAPVPAGGEPSGSAAADVQDQHRAARPQETSNESLSVSNQPMRGSLCSNQPMRGSLCSNQPMKRLPVFCPTEPTWFLEVGSVFSLGCHGNLSSRLTTTSFNWLYKDQVPNPMQVNSSNTRDTGTYTCRYTNQSLEHLHTWIHLYVKDPANPSSVFLTSHKMNFDIQEGEDFLFRCILTDPSFTNLTLQSEDSSGSRGRGLPLGMNVTLDPRRGAVIRGVQRSFRGRYSCSGRKGGSEFRSIAMSLEVHPRLRHPPSLSVSQQVCVRLKGEEFEVTCQASNPSHFLTLTWTPPHSETLNVSNTQHYDQQQLFISSTLTLSPVRQTHSGTYICTAANEAGRASAETLLTVLGQNQRVMSGTREG